MVRALNRTRTCTGQALDLLPLPDWATNAWWWWWWSGRRDSNPHDPGPKPGGLPLAYYPLRSYEVSNLAMVV